MTIIVNSQIKKKEREGAPTGSFQNKVQEQKVRKTQKRTGRNVCIKSQKIYSKYGNPNVRVLLFLLLQNWPGTGNR